MEYEETERGKREKFYRVFFPSSSASSSMRAFWEGTNFNKLNSVCQELSFSHWALFSRMALNASHSSPWNSPKMANILHQSSVWGKGWVGLILGLNKHQDWLWISHHVVQFAWRRFNEHLSQNTLFQMIFKCVEKVEYKFCFLCPVVGAADLWWLWWPVWSWSRLSWLVFLI